MQEKGTMRDHLTIHLSIDWRVLVVLGAVAAILALLYSSTNAQDNADPPPQGSSQPSPGAQRAGLAPLAASSGPSRRFYVTNNYHFGNQALTACTDGFHTASLWEILDVSNLRYAGDLPSAAIRDDSGNGPPSGMVGWVRTGYNSSGSSTVGTGNCDNWTTNSNLSHGTAARLANTWETPPDPVGFWSLETYSCDVNVRVWCVED
jgi:hypothetical protein